MVWHGGMWNVVTWAWTRENQTSASEMQTKPPVKPNFRLDYDSDYLQRLPQSPPPHLHPV